MKKPIRIRGFLGEQSFEIVEGHEFIMASVAEAMVFNSTYRTERQKGREPMHCRLSAGEAVREYKRVQQP